MIRKRQSWKGFTVGQRVTVSQKTGSGSRPRRSTGTVKGFAVSIDCVRVLIDGNKVPTYYEPDRVAHLFEEWDERPVNCLSCGHQLTLVRPGKHQCDNEQCPTNSTPRNETPAVVS